MCRIWINFTIIKWKKKLQKNLEMLLFLEENWEVENWLVEKENKVQHYHQHLQI